MTNPALIHVDVKSPFLSKTNITATLLTVFGLLVAFKLVPPAYATPEFVGSLVSLGGLAVIVFRTFTSAVLSFVR